MLRQTVAVSRDRVEIPEILLHREQHLRTQSEDARLVDVWLILRIQREKTCGSGVGMKAQVIGETLRSLRQVQLVLESGGRPPDRPGTVRTEHLGLAHRR